MNPYAIVFVLFAIAAAVALLCLFFAGAQKADAESIKKVDEALRRKGLDPEVMRDVRRER